MAFPWDTGILTRTSIYGGDGTALVINPDGSINVAGGGGGATALATAADPVYIEGSENPLSLDLSGNLRVRVSGSTNPSKATANAPTYVEGTENLLSTDLSGSLRVGIVSGGVDEQSGAIVKLVFNAFTSDLVCEISYNNQITWVQTPWYDPNTLAQYNQLSFNLPANDEYWGIVLPSGTTNIRFRTVGYVGGSATATINYYDQSRLRDWVNTTPASDAYGQVVRTAGNTDVLIKNPATDGGHVHLTDARGTGFGQQISPIGDAQVQQPVRLIGPAFVGATLDASFWSTSAVGSGAVAVANSVASLTTGGTANSSIILSSVRVARFMFAHPNKARFVVSTTDGGTANNVRRITVGDGTDGIGFVINGAAAGNFGVCYKKAGGAWTDVYALNGEGGASINWSSDYHALEIVYFTAGTWWFLDGVLIHHVAPTTAPITGTLSLPLRIENTNSGGSTTNVGLNVWNASVLRLGNSFPRGQFNHISTNTTTVLKRGPGTLHRIVIGTAGNGNTITIYDNTSAAGTVVAVLTSNSQGVLEFDLDFNMGLTIVTASGTPPDLTVLFD